MTLMQATSVNTDRQSATKAAVKDQENRREGVLVVKSAATSRSWIMGGPIPRPPSSTNRLERIVCMLRASALRHIGALAPRCSIRSERI